MRFWILLSALVTAMTATAQFTQAPLPYSYSALEPYIDSQTMEIHYTKHHAGYISNLNKAVKGTPAEGLSLTALFSRMGEFPDVIRNNAGGHYNHDLFWSVLSPEKSDPSPELLSAVSTAFGNLDSLKKRMNEAGAKRFGSGWAWLSVDPNGKLVVSSTPNQDNPLMSVAEVKGIPVLGIDVWEHAYYLRYQNKRGDYLAAIWNVINWKEVSRRYAEALKK